MEQYSELTWQCFGFIAGVLFTSLASSMVFFVGKRYLLKFHDGTDFKLSWRARAPFWQRCCKIIVQCDPLSLLYSERTIEGYIKHQQALQEKNVEDQILTEHVNAEDSLRRHLIIESAVQPGTTRIVPRPFRMSGYLPFNGPICVMLSLAKTVPTFLFWSWMNQSQAALVNLYNLSADKDSTRKSGELKQILTSYSMAVSCALLSSIGILNLISSNLELDEKQKDFVMSLLPVPSNALAGVANCFMMSRPQLQTGLKILNEPKPYYSKIAAKKAMLTTMFTRSLLPIPCFLIPTFLSRTSFALSVTEGCPEMKAGLDVFLTTVCFGIGLPIALSLFPEIGTLNTEDAEEEIRDYAQHGVLYFNRGL